MVTLEKWFSSMVRVPVSATCPQPQNRATPEKQRMVATSEAYGTPPRHLMQHSKHPGGGGQRNETPNYTNSGLQVSLLLSRNPVSHSPRNQKPESSQSLDDATFLTLNKRKRRKISPTLPLKRNTTFTTVMLDTVCVCVCV